MKTFERIQQPVKTVTDIMCSCCGESLLEEVSVITNPEHKEFGQKQFYFKEHLDITKSWGYGSPKDLSTYSAQICEPCFDKHLASIIKWEIKSPF